MISLSAPSAELTVKRYLSAAANIDYEMKTMMVDMGEFGLKTLKRNVPVKTGALRDSIKYELVKTDRGYQIKYTADAQTISNAAYYVDYVDQGTHPHTIIPRDKRALHFFDRNGNERFAQRVNHPGAKASRFSTRSLPDIKQHTTTASRSLAANLLKRMTAV